MDDLETKIREAAERAVQIGQSQIRDDWSNITAGGEVVVEGCHRDHALELARGERARMAATLRAFVRIADARYQPRADVKPEGKATDSAPTSWSDPRLANDPNKGRMCWHCGGIVPAGTRYSHGIGLCVPEKPVTPATAPASPPGIPDNSPAPQPSSAPEEAPECPHAAWDVLRGGGRRCSDCRVFLSPEDVKMEASKPARCRHGADDCDYCNFHPIDDATPPAPTNPPKAPDGAPAASDVEVAIGIVAVLLDDVASRVRSAIEAHPNGKHAQQVRPIAAAIARAREEGRSTGIKAHREWCTKRGAPSPLDASHAPRSPAAPSSAPDDATEEAIGIVAAATATCDLGLVRHDIEHSPNGERWLLVREIAAALTRARAEGAGRATRAPVETVGRDAFAASREIARRLAEVKADVALAKDTSKPHDVQVGAIARLSIDAGRLVAIVERLRDALRPFVRILDAAAQCKARGLLDRPAQIFQSDVDEARAALAAADGADTQTARDDGQGGTP